MANVSPKRFSEEAEAAVSVLRAIVTSKKGASTVHSVLADFRELEGGPLMYKKFGFPNADEFLKATGAFVVQSRMGESVVFAKHSAASAHIQKMVSAQRSTKTRKSGFAVLRQPQKRTGGSSWNPSAYSKMYPRVPYPAQKKYPQQQQYSSYQRNNVNPSPKQFFPPGSAKYSFNSQPKPLMSLKIAPPAQQSTPVNRPEANNNSSAAKNLNRATQGQGPLPNNDLRHRINNDRAPPPQQRQLSSLELKNRTNQHQQQDLQSPTHVINKDVLQKTIYDALASNQAFNAPRSVNARLSTDVVRTSEPVKPFEASPNGVGQQPRQEFSRPVRPAAASQQPLILTPPVVPLPTLPGKKSLQERLKINQQVDSVDLEKAAKVVAPQTSPPRAPELSQQTSVSSQPVTPPATNVVNAAKEPFQWNDPNATPVELLVQYAQHNGFSRPIYKYLRLKNQRFQCRVTVNGSTYSTYPADYANEFECQFAAARTAIENIKRESERNNYSVCLWTDYEIAVKLYELLLNCPSGMFSKNIPDAFLEAHQSLLPDQWESEIMLARPRMFYKEEVSQASIYFAVAGENGSSESDGSITSEAKIMSVNLVELPWEKTYWDIYVTAPVSTVEVWARLVGPKHSDRMDALSTEIELEMMDLKNQQKPKSVKSGEFYLLLIMDCWHRIRVDEVDYESNTAMCFFIDTGDQETVALDTIYVCDSRYLELPAQSVCFTLDKLEDFGENPNAKPHLDNLICGKVSIGQILTTKEEYDKFDTIKIMLYDTSTDEDVNLNEILLEHICADTPVPELQRNGVTTVTIVFVDDEGNVYCQLKDTAMVYIQKLINNLVENGALDNHHRGLYKTSGDHQLYLVRDEEDHKYYRAAKESKGAGSTVSVLYIDYGIRKTVQSVNLYRLQALSAALSRYPAQAIRTKLFDLPEMNEYLLSRLRALLKPGETAMVKVAAMSSVVPLVKVHMHYGENHILVCLNDSIRAEMELEINSEEVICDPRVAANDANSSFSPTASSARTQFSSPVPSQVVPRLTKCPLPRVGDLFDVTVTIASSPNYFIVQPYRHAKELNTLMVDLQTYCKGPGAQMVPPDSVKQGEVYAGFDSDDGNWYRVLVVNILCGPTLIHVYFCDFGQIKMLDSKMLRVLPQQLRHLLPQQAVKAKLYGVQPRHGDWSTEDAVRFQQLTEGKKFASYIRSIQADEFNPNDDIVELELIDVSTSEDIMVHQQLVDEGRAVLTNK